MEPNVNWIVQQWTRLHELHMGYSCYFICLPKKFAIEINMKKIRQKTSMDMFKFVKFKIRNGKNS